MNFAVDFKELLRFARYMNEIALETAPAVARALNAYGEQVVDGVSLQLSEMTGLERSVVRSAIVVYQADANNPEFSWDATAVSLLPQSERTWTTRDDSIFEEGALYKIVTYEDCCLICEEAAEDSPYTAEQIRDLAAKWANYVPPTPVTGERTNLIHPNCRCVTQPWSGNRRVGVQLGPGGPWIRTTPKALGRYIADEMQGAIRARKQ